MVAHEGLSVEEDLPKRRNSRTETYVHDGDGLTSASRQGGHPGAARGGRAPEVVGARSHGDQAFTMRALGAVTFFMALRVSTTRRASRPTSS